MVVVGRATNETIAVEWMARHVGACDLIIIDIFLTSGSGLGVLKAAVQLSPVPTLAVLTNYATAEMRRQCIVLGATRVFDKSTELDDLVAFCARLGEAPANARNLAR